MVWRTPTLNGVPSLQFILAPHAHVNLTKRKGKLMKKLCIIPLLMIALCACTPKQMRDFRNNLVCAKAQMTNCVVKSDQYGDSSISGEVCEEDMDCWNCVLMGNGVCGPVIIDIPHKMVIAANGRFPYTSGSGHFGDTQCVDGPSPIREHHLTTLACTDKILR